MKLTHPTRTWRFGICFGFVVCVFGLFGSTAQGGGKKSLPPLTSYLKNDSSLVALFKKVIQEPSRCIVEIQCNNKRVALGTIVEKDGWIVTKASVLDGTPTIVLQNGTKLTGKVIGTHEPHDLSLIKIESDELTPAPWRASNEAPVGFWSISAGLKGDLMALGVVSVASRKINYPKNFRPNNWTNSGYLGVALAKDNDKAVIDQVMPGSSASKFGIKVKDIVVAVAGKKISNPENLIETIRQYAPKDRVTIRVKRGEKELNLNVVLGKRKLSRGDIQNNMGSKLSKRINGFPLILQHDGVVLPDQCGGPLIDLDGRVIGVNVARAGRTESYAIPSEEIIRILDEMKTGKFALAPTVSQVPKDAVTPPNSEGSTTQDGVNQSNKNSAPTQPKAATQKSQ